MRRVIVLCALLLAVATACGDDDEKVDTAATSTSGSVTTVDQTTTADDPPETGPTSVDDDPVASDVSITGYETSFGMCAGWCRTTLTVQARELTLAAFDHMEGKEASSTGTLTDAGYQRLVEAASGVVPGELDPVYGCPDCADGGAASLTFTSSAGETTSTYDFGGPPQALVEADVLGADLLEAMRTCTSSDLVTVAAGCEPLAR